MCFFGKNIFIYTIYNWALYLIYVMCRLIKLIVLYVIFVICKLIGGTNFNRAIQRKHQREKKGGKKK